MRNIERQYEPLDLAVLSNKKSRIVSSDEALKDVIAPTWSEDVFQGKSKIVANLIKAEESIKCVK